ncbi:branched-chain amino acid ABC transporter permease [Candidatus Woesearchaeota archaeon]|nr:branched-chain amino acid ABC transporter permease [Candidatus Woesearchaeota archaeon]
MIHEYLASVLTFAFIYVILVASLNIAIGFTGMLNLGHMVFFGIGAYASAILTLNGIPWYIAVPASGAISAILAVAIGSVTVNLKKDYFAMITLGLIFVAIAVARNWISLTRGSLGIPGVPDIIRNDFYYMVFVFCVALLAILFFRQLVNSQPGRIFQAIRDDETAASVLGKNVYLYKIMSMGISSFFAGVAGSLLVHKIKFVDATIFDLGFFIIIISMLIAGGLGSIKGPVVGVFVLIFITEFVRFIGITPALVGALREMIFAAALIVILVFKPRGIFGRVDV